MSAMCSSDSTTAWSGCFRIHRQASFELAAESVIANGTSGTSR